MTAHRSTHRPAQAVTVHQVARPDRAARPRRLRVRRAPRSRYRRTRHRPGREHLPVRRPVHARGDGGGPLGAERAAGGPRDRPRRRRPAPPGSRSATWSSTAAPGAPTRWSPQAEARVLPRTRRRAAAAPGSSVLGGTGLTAYVGLTRIARLQPGETRLRLGRGRRSRHRGRPVRPAARRRTGPRQRGIGRQGRPPGARPRVRRRLRLPRRAVRRAAGGIAPDGVDVGFENVGGDQLGGLIANMRDARPDRLVRRHRPVQRPRPPAGRAPQPLRPGAPRDPARGLPRPRPPRSPGRTGGVPRPAPAFRGRDRPTTRWSRASASVVDAFVGVLRGANTGKMIVQVGDAEEK